MSDQLASRICQPCRAGSSALSAEDSAKYLGQLKGWIAVQNHHLEQEFRFADFRSALTWVNQIGEIAERERHHPDIRLSWGIVVVTIFTHVVNGLTENDFILAAKISAVAPASPRSPRG